MVALPEYITENILSKKTGMYGRISSLRNLTKNSTKDEIVDAFEKCFDRCGDGISRKNLRESLEKENKTMFTVWNRMNKIMVMCTKKIEFDILLDNRDRIEQICEMRYNPRTREWDIMAKYLESISTLDKGIDKMIEVLI